MELFEDGHHVRLRSRETGTYLHADEDGRGVSLSRRRASMNAAWAVHLYQPPQAQVQYLLLHSAAYGRYLAATVAPAPRGQSGLRVEQCDYEPWEEEYIRWQAVRVGSGDDILLRQVAGRLRANGRYLSVDDFNSTGTMMHWVVERIPARDDTPRLAAPTGLRLPRSLAFVLPWRVIQYEQAGAEESNASFAWESLVFRGRSAFHLRPCSVNPPLTGIEEDWRRFWLVGDLILLNPCQSPSKSTSTEQGLRKKLASQLGVAMDVSNLVMCVRAGMHGQLTPLVVDLSRSRETLDIIVVMAGTPAHAELRYPDVGAE